MAWSTFYGWVKGSKGEASRLGTAQSGFTAQACSKTGKVVVSLNHANSSSLNWFEVWLEPHGESDFQRILLARGHFNKDGAPWFLIGNPALESHKMALARKLMLED